MFTHSLFTIQQKKNMYGKLKKKKEQTISAAVSQNDLLRKSHTRKMGHKTRTNHSNLYDSCVIFVSSFFFT